MIKDIGNINYEQRDAGKIVKLIDKAVKTPRQKYGKIHLTRIDETKAESSAGVEYMVGSDSHVSVDELTVIKKRVKGIIERHNITGFEPIVWIQNRAQDNPILQHQSIFIGIIEKQDINESEYLVSVDADSKSKP